MKKKVFRERNAEPIVIIEDAKTEENAPKVEQDAPVQVTEPKKRGRKKSVK